MASLAKAWNNLGLLATREGDAEPVAQLAEEAGGRAALPPLDAGNHGAADAGQRGELLEREAEELAAVAQPLGDAALEIGGVS